MPATLFLLLKISLAVWGLLLVLLLFSSPVVPNSLRSHGLQCVRLPCPISCSNSCPLSQWCHPTISFSVAPFSFCLQSSPPSGSFLIRWLFTSGGQRIRASASASVLPVNSQGWFPLGLTGMISLFSKGFSRFFLEPQFKRINSLVLSLSYGPNLTSIHDYWKNHIFDYMDHCWKSDVYAFQYAV